jgi:hypothetical protein
VTTAVIYLPDGLDPQASSRCLDYCAARKYDVAGVVLGNWEAAATMLCDRLAGVLVVDRPDHLAPDREPRIEVVDRAANPAPAPRAGGPTARRRRRPNQV